MLIIGDIHGDLYRVQAFLKYKPEEQKLFLGDYFDDWTNSIESQMECFRLIIESKAVALWGNHDLHYLKVPPFMCSGYQRYNADNIRKNFIEKFKNNLKACFVVNEKERTYVCTHAGIDSRLVCDMSANSAEKYVNTEMANFLKNKKKNKYLPEPISNIFNISFSRGGNDRYAGVFWMDYRTDGFPHKFGDLTYQVFGHSQIASAIIDNTHNFINMDSRYLECFNTKTHEIEEILI